MIVSISEAARLAGRSRQSLYDMRDRGELSMTTDPVNGRSGIDMAELCRVFPRIKPDTAGRQVVESFGHDLTTGNDSAMTAALQAQIEALKQVIEAKDAVIAEKDARLLMLTDQRQTPDFVMTKSPPDNPPPPAPAPVPRKPRGLLDRLADGLQAALK